MGIFGDVIQYIIDMGASVMLPIVIAVLSVLVGVRLGKAIRSGLMIGVGFVGLSLIVDMMNAQLGPAAKAMSENFGLTLSVVDIGWPGASPMTWASNIATVAIPIAIAVNLIMLFLKLTKTVNIDIWNIWHMTFTGAIAYTVTGNFAIGILGVVIHAAIAYKLGDLWAPMMTDYFELDGITLIQDYTGIDNFNKEAESNYAKFKTLSQELKITNLNIREEDTLLHQKFENTG